MEPPAACALPPVASPVVPVDFTVAKKGPEMLLHDATGRPAFSVAAAAAGAGKGGVGRALLDAAGAALVTVRSSSEGEWQAFSGNSMEQRDYIFTAKVISTSLSRKEVHVFIPPRIASEDPKPSYKLIGSTYRRACTIIKGTPLLLSQTSCINSRRLSIHGVSLE